MTICTRCGGIGGHRSWCPGEPRTPAPALSPLAAEVDQDDAVQCQFQLASLSEWIDAGNAHRDPEAVLWGRVAKLTEEAGEATAALIGLTGQNPRKGVTHTADDVVAELLDVAITALGAVEHLTGNKGHAIPALVMKVDVVHVRAALASPAPAPQTGGMCARCGGDGWTGPDDPRPGVTCDDCNGTGVR